MKKHTLTKKILLIAATVAVLATAIFAGTRAVQVSSHSTHDEDLTALPTARQMERNYGFSPRLAETFANGYTFDRASQISSSAEDEDGRAIENFKALDVFYTLGKDCVSLFVNASRTEGANVGGEAVMLGDLPAYYTAYTAKYVPADYEKTPEDLEMEADGTYIFAYGTDGVELSQVRCLSWAQDGVNYTLHAADSPLTQADLTAMAQELIALPKP